MRCGVAAASVIAFIVLTAFPVAAHSPVDPEDGESLATATHVEDPLKSWAIYGELEEGGDTWYFELELSEGDRLYLSLLTPEEGFLPLLVAMGPGMAQGGMVPAGVETPEDLTGWLVVDGEASDADFEPFTPGSYYFVARVDVEVSAAGTYHVAVHSPDEGGAFSLAVGYQERFTVLEWLSLPVSLIGIYRWDGQGWAAILAPPLAVIVGGLAMLVWQARRRGGPLTVFQWTSVVSGLFIMSWAAIIIAQMARALGRSGWEGSAAVSVGFALGSLALGVYAMTPVLRGVAMPDGGIRLRMAMVGVVALFLYSGLYVGPVMAFIASLLPTNLASRGIGPSARGSSVPSEPDT